MCSCGSRGFFDALGDPWPKHEDSCVAHYVRTLRQSGRSDEAIRALVADEARRRGATVPKSVEQLLTRLHDESKAIVELHPEKQKRQFAGVVQAVDQVNFLKRFKRKDNAAGRLGFDHLLDESQVQSSATKFMHSCVRPPSRRPSSVFDTRCLLQSSPTRSLMAAAFGFSRRGRGSRSRCRRTRYGASTPPSTAAGSLAIAHQAL